MTMALHRNVFLVLLMSLLVFCGTFSAVAEKLNCDFEQGLTWCGFVNGGVPFDVRNRSGTLAQIVPLRGNETGEMFLFRSMFHSNFTQETSTLTTSTFLTPGSYCLRFWLLMATDKEHRFIVEKNELTNPKIFKDLERFVGNEAQTWKKKSISFFTTISFQLRLRLEVIPESFSRRSVFALDDFELDEGKCSGNGSWQNQISCDFEEGSCGYKIINAEEDFQWRLQSNNPQEFAQAAIPSHDSTYHSSSGHFMVAVLNSTETKSCEFQSPLKNINPGESQCISFYYQIFRPSTHIAASLALKVVDIHMNNPSAQLNISEQVIWISTTSHGSNWILFKTNYTALSHVTDSMADLVLHFIATGNKDVNGGYVAIDDISLASGSCHSAGDCNFNMGSSGYCGWQPLIDETSKMIWSNNVPAGEPVSESGYIYFKGGRGSGNFVRSRALLYSEDLDFNKTTCMTFNYYFNASGNAEIRIHQVEAPTSENTIWRHRGQVSSSNVLENAGWRFARVALHKDICDEPPCSDKDFLIVIEGRILREVNYQYYVAIDDVQFQQHGLDCQMVPVDANPIPEVQQPDEHATSVCTFDDVVAHPGCRFLADNNAKLQWNLGTGETVHYDETSHSAPQFDHTTSEDYGHYLYFNAGYQENEELYTYMGDYARQISPLYTRDHASDPRCIRFWYQMQCTPFPGGQSGDFSIFLDVNGNETLLWSARDQNITETWEWTLGIVKQIPNSVAFRLIFEAKILENFGLLNVALDDITVEYSECKEIDCDFEEGMCSWQNFYDLDTNGFADLSWEYGDGVQLTAGITNPFIGLHVRGRFLYVPIISGTQPNHKALLEHQEQIPGETMICLAFEFLVTHDSDIGELTVYEKHIGFDKRVQQTAVWSSKGFNESNIWQQGQIAVTNENAWTLLFEGLANPENITISDELRLLAIDTITHKLISDISSCPTIPRNAEVKPITAASSVMTTATTTSTSMTTKTTPPVTTTANPIEAFNCNFDGGLHKPPFCGWTQRDQDNYRWKMGTGSVSGLPGFGPSGDYFATHNTRSGKYVYIETANGIQGDKARLFSPLIKIAAPYCVRFRYNMNGKGMGNINLFFVDNSSDFNESAIPVFTVYGGDHGNQWTGASYTIQTSGEKVVVLEATRGSLNTSIIAVDEISLNPGVCEPLGKCNFDNGWCNYSPINSETPAVYWELLREPFPQSAHLQHKSYNQNHIPLRSEIFQPKFMACFRFKFMFHGSVLSLNIKMIQFPAVSDDQPRISQLTETVVWSQSATAHATDTFFDGHVPISSANPFQISIYVILFRSDHPESVVYITDIYLSAAGTCSHLPESANPFYVSVGTSTTTSSTTTLGFSEEIIFPTAASTIATPLSKFSCDFEDNHLCGWSDDPLIVWIPEVRWRLSNRSVHSESGPDSDHNGSGYFAYFDSVSAGRATKGELSSPVIEYISPTIGLQVPPSFVLSFWYYMHGAGIDMLTVLTRTQNGPNVSYKDWLTIRGNQGRRWFHQQLVIELTEQAFRVTFKGNRKSGSLVAVIAIDEIDFLDEKIPDQFDVHICDFDSIATCGYQQYSSSHFVWTYRNGRTSTERNDTGPIVDKSQRVDRGFYMAFDARDRTVGGSVMLQSTTQPASKEVCVKFYYYKRSNVHKGTLQVSFEVAGKSTGAVWSDENMIGGDFWQPVFITMQSLNTPNWRVVWEAFVVDSKQPIVAIDHVVMTTNGACEPNLVSCGFEDEGFCEWSNDFRTDDVNWILTYGSSQTGGSGPSGDQGGTEHGGYLLFDQIEADVSASASLISIPITNDGRRFVCFKFWYHMYGVDVGQLTVFQNDLLTGERNSLWLLSNNQHDVWHEATVPLYASESAPYQIILEAKRLMNTGIHGKIAVDEMEEDQVTKHCEIHPRGAEVFPSLSTNDGTSTTPDPRKFICTFEQDTCIWIINEETEMRWRRITGYSSSLTQGPAYDHTTQAQSGYYMIFEGSKGLLNDSARLEGPFLMGTMCLQFYFHAAGLHIGKLNVLQKFNSTYERLSWSRRSADEGRVWQLAEVELCGSGYHIIFEAVHGIGPSGDFALDDIGLGIGLCVPAGKENACDFEDGLCGFQPGETGAMPFLRASPSTLSTGQFWPTHDVSLGTRDGHFLMASMLNPSSSETQIKTPIYALVGLDHSPVCFQFFYYFAASVVANDSLVVSLVTTDIFSRENKETIHRITGDQGRSWLLATHTSYGVSDKPFYASFGVNFDHRATGTVVAIDDVSVTNGTCRHPLDCDFDSDSFCLWYNLINNDALDHFDWQSVSSAVSQMVGPSSSVDATQGWYALASAQPPSQPGDKAWLVSPQVGGGIQICLKFWYYMGGTDGYMSTLRLTVVNFMNNSTATYWRINSGTTGEWLLGQLRYAASFRHHLVFEAEIGNNRLGFVALDNFTVLDNECLADVMPAAASPSYRPPIPTTQQPAGFEFHCDFETGDMCIWKNDLQNDDRCNWTLRKGQAVSQNSGPSSDHTLQTNDGSYLYYQSSLCFDDFTETGAALTTKSVLSDFRETSQCLKFWYHMYGSPNTFLVIKNATNGDLNMEFMRKNNQGKQWRFAEVTIDNPEMDPYYIIIGATRGTSKFGDIALDDFDFIDGSCPSSNGLCDFESGHLCGFSTVVTVGGPSTDKRFKWNLDKVANLDDFSTNQQPVVYDHTFATTEGHIAYADGKSFPKGAVTYLVSPSQTRYDNQDQCLTFWYQLPTQPEGGGLKVHMYRAAIQNQFANPIWSVRASHAFQDAWEYGTVPVDLMENFKYAFEAVNGINAFIALDDVRVINETCPKLLTCDFEDGMCGWTNAVGDHFDWIWSQADSGPGDNFGPADDQTTGGSEGHYIYLANEFSNSTVTAHLTSERILVSERKLTQWCFQFWFHIAADANSTASLQVKLQDDEYSDEIFRSDIYSIANKWIMHYSFIYTNNDFRLVVIGTVGGSGKSSIALDEFKGGESYCDSFILDNFWQCDNGVKIKVTKLCDQIRDCRDGEDENNCGSCSFDAPDLCGYAIVNNTDFSWQHIMGNEGDNHMSAEVAFGPPGSSSYLNSPKIHQTFSTCKLRFFYQIVSENPDPGTIFVSMRTADADVVLAVINSFHPDAWNFYEVDIGRRSVGFQVIFRAEKGGAPQGNLAVDEIEMVQCDFPVATNDPCPDGQWKCPVARVCTKNEEVCDFTDDCGTREDEGHLCATSNPIRCNFDVDFCDWSHDPTADFRWSRNSGRSVAENSVPLVDHTTGMKYGGFIHVTSSPSLNVGGKARLLSPLFNATSQSDNCFIRFYKHVNGNETGALSILVIPMEGISQTTITEVGSGGAMRWIRMQIPVFSAAPFRVALQGSFLNNATVVAVDDVSFSSSCTGERTEISPATTVTESVSSASTLSSSVTFSTSSSLTSIPSTLVASITSTVLTSTQASSSGTAGTTEITLTSSSSLLPTSESSTATRPNLNTTLYSSPSVTSVETVTPNGAPCPGLWCIPSQTCLNESVLCDGTKNCEDGFDESEGSCAGVLPPMNDLDAGTIAGIVLGVLGIIAVVGGFGFLLVRRRHQLIGGGGSSASTTYKNFGTLDGATDSDERSAAVGNNVALHLLFSDDS